MLRNILPFYFFTTPCLFLLFYFQFHSSSFPVIGSCIESGIPSSLLPSIPFCGHTIWFTFRELELGRDSLKRYPSNYQVVWSQMLWNYLQWSILLRRMLNFWCVIKCYAFFTFVKLRRVQIATFASKPSTYFLRHLLLYNVRRYYFTSFVFYLLFVLWPTDNSCINWLSPWECTLSRRTKR